MGRREGTLSSILLTSVTTFLGVLPLILERSTQAQFLIPMAVSLGVGVLFATVLLMMLVPALMMLHHRLDSLFRRGYADLPTQQPVDKVSGFQES